MAIKTFKTRIYPTKNQITYFRKAFGIRRWTWNWGLSTYLESLNDKPKSTFDLQKELNNGLVKDPNYSWLSEVNSMVRGESLKDLGLSIKRYHDEQRKARKTTSYVDSEKFKPKYKSKKHDINSFRMFNKNPIKVNGKKHFLLTTVGGASHRLNIKCAESIKFLNADSIKFCTITISEYPLNEFYASITYEITNHKVNKPNTNTKIGIDMGMKTPLTCYDGENTYKFNPLDRIKKAEKKRERINKKLSRKLDSYKQQRKSKVYTKGFKFKESKRYLKTKQKLQRAYQREENVKKDFREQTTTWLVTNYHTINIEPFTNGFKKSNRAVARISQYLFYERLKQKAELYNTIINWISWEPTTQTCSSCGHRFINEEKLILNNRKYICPNCNLTLDRDINSAINIYNLK